MDSPPYHRPTNPNAEDCLLALGTYAEEGFRRLNIRNVPEPSLIGLGLGGGVGAYVSGYLD